MKRLLLLPLVILLSACTLKIGSPSRLPDAPAPTAIPLSETTAPILDAGEGAPAEPIALPPGFGISVYADGLQDPRMMAVGPDGEVYVAERGAGRILRLVDGEGDGRLDHIDVVAEGLNSPAVWHFTRMAACTSGRRRVSCASRF